jgi:uncharacterized protein YggT (Ycf19 family)
MYDIDRGRFIVVFVVVTIATVFVRWTVSRHRPGAIERSIDRSIEKIHRVRS